MKIDEIKQLTEEFQVASVNGKIVKVELPKQANNGSMSQLFYLEDGTGQMKMKIKDPELFIDNDWGDAEVKIFGTPNAKKVPDGLKYLPKYEMITVTPGAAFEKKKIEKKKPVEIEPDPEQEEKKEVSNDFNGPSDHLIVQEYMERLHIFKVLNVINSREGNIFPKEVLYPMVTSIKIEADRGKLKIIDWGSVDKEKLEPAPAKKKFDNYEKANPNPEPNKAPSPSPAPVKESSKEVITRTSEIKTAIKSMKSKGVHIINEPGYRGDGTIYDGLMDNEARPRLIKWAIKRINPEKKLRGDDLILSKNLIAILNGFSPGTKSSIILESIMLDLWSSNEKTKDLEFDYDMPTDQYNSLADEVDIILHSIEKTDLIEAAELYFKGEYSVNG